MIFLRKNFRIIYLLILTMTKRVELNKIRVEIKELSKEIYTNYSRIWKNFDNEIKDDEYPDDVKALFILLRKSYSILIKILNSLVLNRKDNYEYHLERLRTSYVEIMDMCEDLVEEDWVSERYYIKMCDTFKKEMELATAFSKMFY